MKEQEDSLERTDQEDDKITNKVEQWKETMTTTGQTQCGEVKTSVSNKLAQKEQKKFRLQKCQAKKGRQERRRHL